MSGDPRDLVVTRVFDAPVEQVWRAWSDPEQVKRWWGPTGFTCPRCDMDFREGGTTLVCMRAPEEFGGQDLYNTWTYRKIEPMRRIEFVTAFTDEHGARVEPASLGLPPEIPQDVLSVWTLEAVGEGKTEMIATEFGFTSDNVAELSKVGLEQCLDKMAATFVRT
jgi:uncharacterized protein YndB with AHSA1/START domain